MMPQRFNTARNALLRCLPSAESALFEKQVEAVELAPGDVLCNAGATIRHAMFPTAGVISVLACNAEEQGLEIGLVGRDGMFGVPLAVGFVASPLRAIVRSSGSALCVEAARFRRLLADCPVLHGRLHRYTHALLTQATQGAVCNRFHSVESRTARWMLATGDRMDSNVFLLTQSFLADMLGILRPAVNRAARRLLEGGLIAYRRGEVTILDRPGLIEAACSCYAALPAPR